MPRARRLLLSSQVLWALAGCRQPASATSVDAATPAPACVDPYEDALPRMRAFEPDRAVERAELSDSALLDLDADGRVDHFIGSREWCGTGGCSYWLYLSRGQCGTYVGQIDGKELRSLGPGSTGLLDLGYVWWWGCCEKQEQVARFDGVQYRVSHRDCGRDSDATSIDAWSCGPWRRADAAGSRD